MKKIITSFLIVFFLHTNAQIGGGWDWAFNTGSLGGATVKHMRYSADNSQISFAGEALAEIKLGATTLTAANNNYNLPGTIQFLAKIDAATGIPTVLKSYSNLGLNFDCVTTDEAGNFYVGGGIESFGVVDLGNGVTVEGNCKAVIAKFDAYGNVLWAKTFVLGETYVKTFANKILKLAVAPSGNIFFYAYNYNDNNCPLYKLDNNGNVIWFKDAHAKGNLKNKSNKAYLSDKFIDNDENVYLFLNSPGKFVFDDQVTPSIGNFNYGATIVILDSAGTIKKAQTYQGVFNDFQVIRSSGNMVFKWDQDFRYPDAAPFNTLLKDRYKFSGISKTFTGVVETTKDFVLLKAKDYYDTKYNAFILVPEINNVLALPNGKLLFLTPLKRGKLYTAGVDYVCPLDNTNYATAIIETDTDWNFAKIISGGKAPFVGADYMVANDGNYAIAAAFFGEDQDNTTDNPPMPITSYGSVNLATPNIVTYPNSDSYRKDVAIVQTKSSNFPKVNASTWLGNTTDWGSASNWSNGVPNELTKAIFSQNTVNNPTTGSKPKAALVEVSSGVNVTINASLVLTGGVKNDGNITITYPSFFEALGAQEWKGTGNVDFPNGVGFYYTKLFGNSISIGANGKSEFDLEIRKITFNKGVFIMNYKTLTITDPDETAISGTNSKNYFVDGTLERHIKPTGVYEFAMGFNDKAQTAIITANNLIGVETIKVAYKLGVPTGTTPNILYYGTTITDVLNGGWFTITPDKQPTGGTYDVNLKIQNSNNSNPTLGGYTIIKRENSTANWEVSGTYNMATASGGTISVVNNDLTSFSEFAIGKGNVDINTSNKEIRAEFLTVFPNPTKNVVTISAAKNIASISVYDVSGKQILTKNNGFNKAEIDLSNNNSGIYYLKVLFENGVISNMKIIKN